MLVCISLTGCSLLDKYAASGTVKKVIEINPYLLGTMAGGAGTSFFAVEETLFTFSQISRLSVLGNLSWNALPTTRITQSRTNFRVCG